MHCNDFVLFGRYGSDVCGPALDKTLLLLRPLGGGVRAWRWWVKLRVARTIWKVVLESSPARRPGVAWT